MKKRNQHFLKGLAAGLTVMALVGAAVVGLMPKESKAGRFTTTGTQDSSTAGDSVTLTLSFDEDDTTTAHDLVSGDEIIVSVPSTFGNFSSLTAGDVSIESDNTGNPTTFGAPSFDTTQQTITFAVTAQDGDTDTSETITITIGDSAGNELTLPSTYGQTAVGLIVDTASGANTSNYLFDHSNDVSINAEVFEALTMGIDSNEIDLAVNPAVNSGEDYSKYNTITVSTNAGSGYAIKGKQDNGAALDGPGTNTIASGNPVSTENTFGYVVDPGTPGSPTIGHGFSDTDTTLLDESSANVGGTAPTNSDSFDVYYLLNVDYLTPAGEYLGTVTYTATPTF